ncbi:MAG TPA: hypothetical protein VFV10_13030 [Gammaproteobacteria bacterium]|nr:hypothetical protein [Gammaproteobacteria bacterium]
MQIDTLGILLGFAAVTLAALEPRRPWVALVSLAGFAAGAAWLGPARFPDPGTAAFLAAGPAALALAKPRWGAGAAACAGLAAALWAGVMQVQGLPALPAAAVAALPPAAAALLARRSGRFAPAGLREEALALVVVLGLLVALVPEVVAGWRSASAFGSTPQEAARAGGTAWMLAAASLCAVGGALYALWRRRRWRRR